MPDTDNPRHKAGMTTRRRVLGDAHVDRAEAMRHVAIYCGAPRANHAIRIVKATYAEMGEIL